MHLTIKQRSKYIFVKPLQIEIYRAKTRKTNPTNPQS